MDLLVDMDGPSGKSTTTRVAMYIFVDSDSYYRDILLVKALRTIFSRSPEVNAQKYQIFMKNPTKTPLGVKLQNA